MKIRFALLIILLNGVAFGQSEMASAVRAKNGKMISLTNLADLKDCGVKNVEGKVREVRMEQDRAVFDMGKKHQKETVSIDLKRLEDADRRDFSKQLVKEGLLLRVSGYICGSDEIIEAISIDRVY
jgi:hypothetical protein